MVQLCSSNRAEGFGPHSSIHPSTPTTCFMDVIVEPLPTWIFMLLMLALLPLRLRHRRHSPGKSIDSTPSTKSRASSICSSILSTIYYFLILAIIAMQSLEIARLVAAELGIGLLPFTYVGILIALANRLTWKEKISRAVNAGYWVMMTTVLGLKVAAEQGLQMSGERRVKGEVPVGNYPTSDEALDNAVMTGVVFVLAVLELVDLASV